ncbi:MULTISPECIES: adenine nucleotide alpha hydrolase family protein [Gracilibacillus]|uniref:histidine kinase n=1 Tax=Gracilibacillus TaxID=74385 RepID=UPI0008263FDE|nr:MULTISPECIES: histidine kinase [Gracilibacillus]
MKKVKSCMDESILVCVYYGPNGERLIKRGHKLAQIMDCPLYVLTVDNLPYDAFDPDKSEYVDKWKELCDELDVDAFIIRDNEKRSSVKVIKEVAHQYNITQIILGQSPQRRWEEITKGSFVNVLLKELTFIDLHIVSLERSLKGVDNIPYEKGVRGFLREEEETGRYLLSFTRSKHNLYEGIFYKEVGTDFNNGIFKFIDDHGKMKKVHVTEDICTGKPDAPPNVKNIR